MASIKQNIVGDQVLQLGNEDFVRGMSFGYNWLALRIAVRWSMVGGTDISSAILALGVCEGAGNSWKGGSITDSVGVKFGGNASVNLVAGATGGNNWYRASNTGFLFIRRVGAADTTVAANSSPPVLSRGPAVWRSIMAFDIRRTSLTAATYSVQAFAPAQASTAYHVDISRWLFLNSITSDILPPAYTDACGGNAVNINYAGNGYLDSVFVSWNYGAPTTLELSDITVLRWA